MGTHAMIGIYDEKDGSVTASYCHYDGYVEGVGSTLFKHYNTQYDAEVVAKGGYISGLYSDYMKSRQEAVHHDRAMVYDSVEEFLEEGYDYSGAEYLYLFDGEAWFVASYYGERRFTDVETMLQKKVA